MKYQEVYKGMKKEAGFGNLLTKGIKNTAKKYVDIEKLVRSGALKPGKTKPLSIAQIKAWDKDTAPAISKALAARDTLNHIQESIKGLKFGSPDWKNLAKSMRQVQTSFKAGPAGNISVTRVKPDGRFGEFFRVVSEKPVANKEEALRQLLQKILK